MGPVSWMDRPKTKPTSALFTAADANESGAYVGAKDIVQRNQMFTSLQRDEAKALFGQDAKTAQQPERVEVKRVQEGKPASRVLSPQEWAKQRHPDLVGFRFLPRRINDSLRAEYQMYARNELAQQESGRRSKGLELDRRQLEAYEDRTKAQFPPGWRESSRGKPEDALAAAAIAEQLAAGKTPTAALRAYKAAAAGGKTPPGAKNLIETVFGIAGFGGLLEDLEGKPNKKNPDKGPVLGWLRMYRELSAFLLVSPDFSDAVSGILAEYAPTPEQLREALDSGKLTPEQQALVEQTLGQLEAMEAQPAGAPALPAPARQFQPPTFLGE